jgi:hypothetical protein
MAATAPSVCSIHSLKTVQAAEYCVVKARWIFWILVAGLHVVDGQSPEGDSKGDRDADLLQVLTTSPL